MRLRFMSKFGIQLLILLSFALSAAAYVVPPRTEKFTIEDFHSEIVVTATGAVDVTEKIEVRFTESRHGIYREIPFRYVDEFGDKLRMPITVKSVTHDDGSPWKYKVSTRGDVVNIRIGNPRRYVDGQQTYVINYTVDNALLFLEDHDELYWNVTGSYWRTSIANASATIYLETAEPSSQLTGACYTGPYGATESQCSYEQEADHISFVATRALGPSEGFTVAMGWDQGLIQPPSAWQQFLWSVNARDNWVFLVPIGILIFMTLLWYRKGRDPKVREAITVRYEPPTIDGKQLTAAEAGVIIDERFDQRDVTASLIGLAASGYLALHEAPESDNLTHGDNDFTLVKLKEPDSKLSDFERALMEEVFSGDSRESRVSEMRNKFYTKLPRLRRVIFEQLVDRKVFAGNPQKVSGRYAGRGILLMFISGLALYLLSPYNRWAGVLAGVLSGIAVIAFSKAMPAKTRVGALAKSLTLGFQEFMNRADKDRLERMGEHVFYKYLAYAIALDVVDHWVKAFEGILTEPPSWFVPLATAQTFSARQFARSISGTASHLGSTMFSAPRGSGSGGSSGGGGGFSGGGGGGGGGGSW